MKNRLPKGSLTIVGTGIQAITHVTPETRSCIEEADKVLYLMVDPVTILWIRKLNPSAESMGRFYGTEKLRKITYSEMTEQILHFVRKGLDVCAVFYGHPGVYVESGHAAIRRARAEGFPARMLPAISAMDCLYADVGVDPGALGSQSYGATHFLRRVRKLEPGRPLFLWQVGLIGETRMPLKACNRGGLKLLVGELKKFYPRNHKVIIYEASQFVTCKPVVRTVRLADLPTARVSPLSTLYVPPLGEPRVDRQMLRLLLKVTGHL
jgi:precorrin-6B methylase 1